MNPKRQGGELERRVPERSWRTELPGAAAVVIVRPDVSRGGRGTRLW
jgi:hypothetical protein